MAVDLEKLVVSLEANLKSYERALAKASGYSVSQMRKIERDMTSIGTRIERRAAMIGKGIAKGIGGGFLAGGVAGLVSQQTFRQLGQMVKSVADLGDEAERAGVSAEALQSLGFVAKQNGVEVDTLTDALKKLNLEVGEAQSKGNDLGKIFAANGKVFSEDATENFRTVADLIANARTEQDKAVIGAAAFGKAYGDLIPVLNLAAEGIRKGEKAARDTGTVISNELVAKAQEFDDRWTAAMDVFSAKGKGAVIGVMSDMQSLINMTADFFKAMGVAKEAADALSGSLRSNILTGPFMMAYDRYGSGGKAQSELDALKARRKEIEATMNAESSSFLRDQFAAELDFINKQISALDQRNAMINRGNESGFGPGRTNNKQTTVVPLTIPGTGGSSDAPAKIRETTAAIEDQKAVIAEYTEVVEDAGNEFQSTFADPMKAALSDLISVTTSFSDAIENMAASIQRSLADMASDRIINALFGLLKPDASFHGGGMFQTGGGLYGASQAPNVASGGGGRIAVNVQNFGGAKVETQERRGPGGERQIMLMIDRRIAQQIADPYSRSSQALNARGAKAPVNLR